jgi:L-2-hydroxyglutarate oxidase
MNRYDLVVIGGGIVGLAVARAIVGRRPLDLAVLEAENRLAAHQTGHNSGVIHSGLYYLPGSLKAVNCIRGREMLYRFCREHDIPHERCGKLVVATTAGERLRLEELRRRGEANGLKGLTLLESEALREREPHASGLAALFVPQTGIVDFVQVAETLGRLVGERGGDVLVGQRVMDVRRDGPEFVLVTLRAEIRARRLINCGGLYSDRIARLSASEPGLRIVPFRGEYFDLVPERRHLVRNLIYPVPDPRFPFLGAHFTRTIQGGVEAGPNAVLALSRKGYSWRRISLGDTCEMLRYGGFRSMVRRHWRMGLKEMTRSLAPRAFVAALQRLVPEVRLADVRRSAAGVRAQAVAANGDLIDDFRIVEGERTIHVLNAPSPAATASLAIGETIADIAEKSLI